MINRQTAPMPSSAQSSSARNHKSTGKPPSPFKKKSNIACTSIICAQAGADRISTGDSDGALALLPAKAQPEPAVGARCECCSRTALISGSMATKEDARQPGNPGTLNKNCLNSGPPLSYAQHNTCIA